MVSSSKKKQSAHILVLLIDNNNEGCLGNLSLNSVRIAIAFLNGQGHGVSALGGIGMGWVLFGASFAISKVP